MLEHFKFCKTRLVHDPIRGTEEAAGIDFFIPYDLTEKVLQEKMAMTKSWPLIKTHTNSYTIDSITLKSGQSVLIPCGIHICLEKGYCLKFENKSGVASKKHLLIGACVIDSDYEGEIHINLHNVSSDEVTVESGEKIVQGVIYKVELPKFEEYESLEKLYEGKNSARKAGGFGSTNK